jgi:hypothetical protein
MDVIGIINELRKELERIDGLIIALESLQAGRRRGRPPKALQQLRAGAVDQESPAARRAAKAVKKATKKAAKKSAGKKKAAKKTARKKKAST